MTTDPLTTDRSTGGDPDTGRLDNPVWAALTGPHRHLAESLGLATRYLTTVCPFAALADGSDPAAWSDLAALIGPGQTAWLPFVEDPLPPGWEIAFRMDGVQLVAVGAGSGTATPGGPELLVLGPDDLDEMLDLVRRTEPGPFLPRTPRMGRYLGVRRGGKLVAMAGERMRPPGFTEVSAVCTHPAHRGQGLAGRLVEAVVAGIQARGETPFLHAVVSNTDAVRLYEALGFERRRSVGFTAVRSPA